MSVNHFGHVFKWMTWGESHGPALGVIVDGCPAGIPLVPVDIQQWLNKRRPAQNRYTTQRKETDTVQILSGVFENVTTGAPISLMIENVDQKSKDYTDIANKFRPGHGDFVYQMKYGIRDYRGGGRASARETASRVAAGAVARAVLKSVCPNLVIRGALIQIGDKPVSKDVWNWKEVNCNPFWSPDSDIVPIWSDYIDALRKQGDTTGAVIEIHASNIPVGIGAPVYAKIDQDIASALMSINAVKGVEIGDGFSIANQRGSTTVDEMRSDGKGGVEFLSNHAGGILAGITTGQDIITRFAVKPTSSILTPQRTVDTDFENTDISTKGRHDPCVGIRAVPVGEAMVACVILDHLLMDNSYRSLVPHPVQL